MAELIAAIDQGTTSTRCMLFNQQGQVVAMEQKEHRQIFPRPGWVEHDAVEILAAAQEVLRGALRKAAVDRRQLAAIAMTNQRETTVVWEKATGRPVGNAIVWQDTRTAPLCSRLAEKEGPDRWRAKTGLPLATYFSATKIKWILENVAGCKAEAKQGRLLFGTMDSWLIWNLSGGVHVTDVTNASRTLLMNLETLEWDEEILQALAIPRTMLPRIMPSSMIYAEAAGEWAGVPIAGDLGDQQAALFGQTCFTPGEAKNTYGTGCFMLLNTGNRPAPSQHGLLTTVGYQISGQPAVYCLEGSIAIAGALVQWLRDNLGLFGRSADIETLARSVTDSGGMYLVPAFSGLYAPHWRSDARGVMVGLTRYIHKGHLCRAALEATAYQTREVLEAMNKDSGITLTELRVDGGMVANELLMQFQADMIGVPVVRPKITETTALGAAYAAGLAIGFWHALDDLRRHWGKDREWLPRLDAELCEKKYRGWQKAVTRSLEWVE